MLCTVKEKQVKFPGHALHFPKTGSKLMCILNRPMRPFADALYLHNSYILPLSKCNSSCCWRWHRLDEMVHLPTTRRTSTLYAGRTRTLSIFTCIKCAVGIQRGTFHECRAFVSFFALPAALRACKRQGEEPSDAAKATHGLYVLTEIRVRGG